MMMQCFRYLFCQPWFNEYSPLINKPNSPSENRAGYLHRHHTFSTEPDGLIGYRIVLSIDDQQYAGTGIAGSNLTQAVE